MMALSVIILGAMASSCGKHGKPSEERKVMVMISLGYNSISSYLKEDLQDMQQGAYLPSNSSSSDVLLIFSKQTAAFKDYKTPTEAALIRLYKNKKGVAVMDTLKTYPSTTVSASVSTIKDMLTYVQTTFKAKSYGIVFSSHATGWLPAGYYTYPSKYTSPSASPSSAGKGKVRYGEPVPVPYVEEYQDPSLPPVKTAGQEVDDSTGSSLSYEMEIEDLAAAIPMHLDYFLFDACLMGGIETAYAFRNVTDVIGFSQTEVLAEGFDYTQLAQHLLQGKTPDPVSVCKDYFDLYNQKTSSAERSATISIVDCKALDQLAAVCKDLFERYRSEIAAVNPSKVQRYFRSDKHWFYDPLDILIQSGATDGDIKRLSDSIDATILYKGATPSFMDSFDINVFSGYSMYLPCNGSTYLDNHYRNLSWNKATLLVPND